LSVVLCGTFLFSGEIRAAQPTTREALADFDKRRPVVAEQAERERVKAEAKVRERVPGTRIDRSPGRLAPKFIGSTRGLLTGAEGEGGAVPATRARGFAKSDPHRVVKAFVEEHRALFGHGAEALTAARAKRDYTQNGSRTTVWQQELEGIAVFEAVLQAHATPRGELVNIGSSFVPDLAKAVGKGAPNHAARIAAPAVSAAQAVALAAQNAGEEVSAAQVMASEAAAGPERKQHFRAPRILDVSAEYAWLPVDDETLRLCWQVVFMSKARGEMFKVLVDAETGEAMVRQGLTNYISDASYRVFTSDSPSPFSPGHPTPLATQPPTVSRTLLTTPALDTTASPNGWIDDGINETRGNNVDAHTDTNADNVADLPRPQGSPVRVFDFPLDLTTQAPASYKDAAVTQLFYWCNWMHDKLYALGFTEAAGNFQNNTFGKGGIGNDAVQADAQDGSGTNNANFSTPPDGSAGRMQMYTFTGPTPDRDGDFDAEVILHEYTHGLSNRLVGGGVGISALVTRGMGEGWSDFYGLALLSSASDEVNGTYAAGAYLSYQLSGLTTNYYYGIRRYPYCTDLAKNPLTLKDIDPAQASAHAGVPKSPLGGSTADEVHNMGEVWCVTLWDVRANLIAKHGYAIGNQLTLQLVTDGMKLSPANPNFLQARDAIIQADLVANAGANRGELWVAFAKRGMGASATAPASSTTVGLVESYDLPDDLGVSPSGLFTSAGMVGGPFTPSANVYTLTNRGTAPLNWTATKTKPWLTLSAAGGTLAVGANTTVTGTLNAAANSLPSGTQSDTITFTNTTSGIAQPRGVQLTIEPITLPIFAETWESGTVGSQWAITGTNTHRTQNTTVNAPHGGTRHLTMDSSVDDSYSRNEATLTVNLAGRHNVQLRFWAKMFSDEPDGPPASPFVNRADFDGVAISADGTNWYEVQPLRALTAEWQRLTVDLDAALAAHGLSYNATFKIRFDHYDNFTIPTDGFAFDDIELVEVVNNRLTLSLPAAVAEGAGTITGTLTVVPVPASDLAVTLMSSDASEATVPASVLVPAGQSTVSVPVTLHEDGILDGTQNVLITATAPGFANGSTTLAVEDNQTATLALTAPATAAEGVADLNGNVTMSAPAEADISVTLLSSNSAELQVPATVMIPAGQSSANFPITVVDDNRIDGTITTTLTAHVANWTDGAAAIAVADNENTDLVLSLPGPIREGDSPRTGTVRIAGTLPTALTVGLACNDTTELTVPASATIAAGQTSATFAVTVVNDTEADGAQPVNITASAAGFGSAVTTVSVADNDAHHFAFAPVESPQIRNAPIALSITAKDVNDAPITNFNSSVALTAASGQGTVALSPATLTGWVNGVWSGNATVNAFATNVVLTANDGQSHIGASNAFNVTSGPLHHFGWSTVASPQAQDTPLNVTLTAQDAGNNPVTTFAGTAALGVELASAAQRDIGTGTTSWDYPLHTGYHDSRTQTIYLASELGAAGRIRALSLYVNSLPGQAMNAWTIRLKHTNAASYPQTGAQWESAGWTTVYQANQTVTQTGWVTFTFATPFDYDGTSNLLVDFSHNNTSWTTSGTVRVTPAAANRALYYYSDSQFGDPLTWSGTTPRPFVSLYVPNLRLTFDVPGLLVPIDPMTTGSFTSGTWTGPVSIPLASDNLRLVADDGAGHSGKSNSFAAQAPVPPTGTGVLFSETFESGTLGAWWTVTGTGPYRTQVTTANGPHGGSRHLTMDSSIDGTYARNEATLTVNLAGRSGVTLSFWAKGYAEEPNGPPASPFLGGADFDGVAISANGTNWYEVQALRSFNDVSTYAQYTVNLDAAIAARGLSYNANFKIRFNQYDNFGIATDGIGIDDITITTNQLPTATLTIPAQATEGAGVRSGTVTLATPATSSMFMALNSSAPAKVSVPANVFFSVGQSIASFPFNVLNNTLLDGNRNVTITATPPGSAPASASILIIDNETATLSLSAPATAIEGVTGLTATATLSKVPSGTLTFTATSNDTSEVTVPATITFNPGQTSVTFPLTIVNDTLIDGTQTATISVGATGWTSASASIAVADNETTDLALNLAASAREGDAAITGTVLLSGTLPTDVTVALASSDSSEITVPASITIAAGQTSAPFSVTIVDDSEFDGAQSATVSVTATGFSSAARTVTVADNEAHHFVFGSVASPQTRGASFPLTLTAKDVNDATVTNFNATMPLTGAAGWSTIAVTPASLSGWVNGVWSGAVTVNDFATGVVLTADGGGGRIATSNSFDVGTGPFAQFGWKSVPSPQSIDQPFAVTLTAQDSGGNPVPSFTGTANLAALTGVASASIGAGTTTDVRPFYGSYHDARTQVIYLASEFGGAGRITALALYVGSASTGTFNNWTIRLKHTAMASYASAAWEGTGWTVVHQSNATPSAIGWVIFPFSTPFDYDGTSNLLVDFSFNNTASTSSAYCQFSTSTSGARAVYGYSNSTAGDPLTWSGTGGATPFSYTAIPNLQLTVDRPLPMRPATTGAFSGGVWTGEVSMPFAAQSVRLKADDAAAHNGVSNSFAVQNPPVTNAALPFVETFESGALSPAWSITGTGTCRTEVTTFFLPHGGAQHLAMYSDTVVAARNEATLTLNLAGYSGVTLTFWAKEFNDLPHGPPTSPFTGGADFDGVAISADGTNWYEVQPLRTLANTWSQLTVDLDAAIAAHGLSYNSAFKIRFNQYDNDYIPYRGITIDDIAITGTPSGRISVTIPAQASEGAGVLAGSVTLPAAQTADVVVALASSASAKVSVSPSVIVPAGQLSASFNLNVLDDAVFDGNKTVALTPSAAGFFSQAAFILVLDNEVAPLTISVPSTTTEGATNVTGTLTLGVTPSSPFTVGLATSDVTEIQVPATATFGFGQTTLSFPITVVNDTEIDGPQTVTLSANAPGGAPMNASIVVQDNETKNLTLSGISSVTEGQSVLQTVSISGTLPTALVVTLTCSLPADLAVPATVTIPAGQTSASFIVSAVDDTATDGTKNATLTASATGFTNASKTVAVADNDVHHFTFGTISSPRIANQGFATTIQARDVNNLALPSFNGSVNLTATGSGGAVAVAPASVNLTGGSWSGSLAITAPATAVTITASAAGATGASNAFDVGVGTVDHFTWDTVGSPQTLGVPFSVSIFARDTFNNTVPSFNAAATLTAQPPARVTGTGVEPYPFLFSSSPQQRDQAIFLPAEVGTAGRITALAVNASVLTGATLTNFTIRLKHTPLALYGASPVWENTGWTTVYQGNVTISGSGAVWINIPLTTPFQYNGTSSLMVDISHNGSSGVLATCVGTAASTARTSWFNGSGYADPLTWSGTSPAPNASVGRPNLRLQFEPSVPLTPTSTTAFINGMWTGQVTAQQAASSVVLRAVSGSIIGESNTFNVTGYPNMQVTPLGLFAATGNFGGPFTPDSASYTIRNAGSAPLVWTVSTTAPWLSLSPSGGTLAADASTTVVVSLAAATTDPGSYTNTIVFTNASNGLGNTTRAASLTVTLPAPALLPEPAFTIGTVNIIAWNTVFGAGEYEVQCAGNAAFNAPSSSGWITDTNDIFSGLADGQTYFYRVRARHPRSGVASAWSSSVFSTQDASGPIIGITTPLFVTTPALALAGTALDAAGVTSVTVNGAGATSGDSFNHWTAPTVTLTPGFNTFTILARDAVLIGNVSTLTKSIFLGSPGGDADGDKLPDEWEVTHGLDPFSGTGANGPAGDIEGDGLSNLLELAFGLDPRIPDANGAPVAALEINPADGEPYLIVRYRRLLAPGDLVYAIELSNDLATWTPATASDCEELAPAVSNVGGLTETVTVRVKPRVNAPANPARHVRIGVTIP
jgi:hypothetical protein